MPKVIFLFDKEKDARNCWDKANREFEFGSKIDPRIKRICYGKKFEDCKEELLSYLKKVHNSPFINITIKSVEKAWRKIEKEFFSRMNKLMKNEFNKNIKAYLTTIRICPYNPDEPSFMFSLFNSLPENLNVCGHEIMHLYFHKFYLNNVEEQIGKEKTSDLKEALTILLNYEFKDLWFVEDRGYDKHQELRKFISEEWKKTKDFNILIEKCAKYLKKN